MSRPQKRDLALALRGRRRHQVGGVSRGRVRRGPGVCSGAFALAGGLRSQGDQNSAQDDQREHG